MWVPGCGLVLAPCTSPYKRCRISSRVEDICCNCHSCPSSRWLGDATVIWRPWTSARSGFWSEVFYDKGLPETEYRSICSKFTLQNSRLRTIQVNTKKTHKANPKSGNKSRSKYKTSELASKYKSKTKATNFQIKTKSYTERLSRRNIAQNLANKLQAFTPVLKSMCLLCGSDRKKTVEMS